MRKAVLHSAMGPSEASADCRFAFGGTVGDVLRDYFDRDKQQSRLPAKFRLYYRFRHRIPLAVRHWLQRGRNQGIDVPADWFLSQPFRHDVSAAMRSQPDTVEVHPWPDGCGMSAVLTHDVETSDGVARIDRLAALEEKHGFRSAWNFVPHAYPIDSGLLTDLKQRGHEIGVHGYNHDGRLFESQRTFQRRVPPINQAIAEFGCKGFRAPMVHRNLDWMQALDIQYDASCFDVDPYQAMPGGVGGLWPFICGKFVELPYTLPQDHTLLVSLKEATANIWIEKITHIRAMAGMGLLITHPDYLNTPHRLDIYESYLKHLKQQQGCWHALPHEVADWWQQRDELEVIECDGKPKLIGPMAHRGRVFKLAELLPH